MEKTVSHYGRLDICVANAAVNPFYGSLTDASDDAFDKTMSTNVKAVWWLAQLAKPHLVASREGAFIVISSIAAIRGTPVLGVYGISKAGRGTALVPIAVEWGKSGICVNAIAPGLVKTRFCARLVGERGRPQEAGGRNAAEAARRADDIAGVALFLASRAARFVTGQVLVVDGGVTIGGTGE